MGVRAIEILKFNKGKYFLKKVLIISPYFPPSNAADMQRIRMSLPYFSEYGWQPAIVTVDESYSEMVKDELLSTTVPAEIKVYKVKALSKKITSKIGLGSLALRSLFYYRNEVDKILKNQKFDLIYFSTTQFPVCILGAYWKKKFKIPYVIDMQDPWFTDYYQDKPKNERPPKYWFAYRLNKWLEPIAIKSADGLVSVSQSYIDTLKERYPSIKKIPAKTITFGAFEKDFEILESHSQNIQAAFEKKTGVLNLVYIGRGGFDMKEALEILFMAFKKGLEEDFALFGKFHFHFIGTSYAPKGQGKQTIFPVASALGLADYVTEQTDRVGFYNGLQSLRLADGLIVPGSNDPTYTASKLYPYILSKKPLLGIFNNHSSAVEIMQDCNAGECITLNMDMEIAYNKLSDFLALIASGGFTEETNWKAFESYTAREMTKQQTALFNEAIS